MNDELSTDELAQMRERAEEATPGPWDWTTPPRAELQNPDGVPIVRTATIGWADPPDAEFIARARTDVPRLLDALEAERRWKAFGEGVLNLVRRSQNDPHFAVVNIEAAGYVGSVIRASDIIALANEHNLLND